MTETIIAEETRAGDSIADAGKHALRSREDRALKLFENYGDKIEQPGEDLYYVPSQAKPGERTYRVVYSGAEEDCECADWIYRGQKGGQPCVHLLTVGILAAKRQAQRRKNFIAAIAAAED